MTVALIVYKQSLHRNSPEFDRALGEAMSGLSGDDDAARGRLLGSSQAIAVAADTDVKESPDRTFLHVPLLPAGQQCSVVFIAPQTDLAHTHGAVYSIWADGISVESQPVPGYADAVATALRNTRGRQ